MHFISNNDNILNQYVFHLFPIRKNKIESKGHSLTLPIYWIQIKAKQEPKHMHTHTSRHILQQWIIWNFIFFFQSFHVFISHIWKCIVLIFKLAPIKSILTNKQTNQQILCTTNHITQTTQKLDQNHTHHQVSLHLPNGTCILLDMEIHHLRRHRPKQYYYYYYYYYCYYTHELPPVVLS